MTFTDSTLQLTAKNWPLIQKLAKKGVARAEYLMGIAYLLGGLVDVSITQAFHWFSRAANNKHADAAFRCGYLISSGKFDVKEAGTITTAQHWYLLAANLGSPAAMVALGNEWTFSKLNNKHWWHRFYAPSDLSEKAVESFSWYHKASLTNYSASFYFLGLHFLKGWGVKKSTTSAKSALENGVLGQDADCAFLLATLAPRKSTTYIDYCTRAADWGLATAQFQLGSYLLNKANRTSEAVSWLRRSAMQRHPPAMLLMSRLYNRGKVVEASSSDAYIWARRAVSAGLYAQSWVSFLYTKLSEEEKQFVSSPLSEKGDSEFHSLSKSLFGDTSDAYAFTRGANVFESAA